MSNFRFTPDAIDDPDAIWLHIYRDNPAAADAVENEICAACEMLAAGPLLGHQRAYFIACALLDTFEISHVAHRL